MLYLKSWNIDFKFPSTSHFTWLQFKTTIKYKYAYTVISSYAYVEEKKMRSQKLVIIKTFFWTRALLLWPCKKYGVVVKKEICVTRFLNSRYTEKQGRIISFEVEEREIKIYDPLESHFRPSFIRTF